MASIWAGQHPRRTDPRRRADPRSQSFRALSSIIAAEVLPENLPTAWQNDQSTALAIATALSLKAGKVLPWKTVRDAINGALQARFVELVDGSAKWPCEFHAAQSIRLRVAKDTPPPPPPPPPPKVIVASAYLEPAQIQDLAEKVSELLTIKAKYNVPIRFHVRMEVGDGHSAPSKEAAAEVARVLAEVADEF